MSQCHEKNDIFYSSYGAFWNEYLVQTFFQSFYNTLYDKEKLINGDDDEKLMSGKCCDEVDIIIR